MSKSKCRIRLGPDRVRDSGARAERQECPAVPLFDTLSSLARGQLVDFRQETVLWVLRIAIDRLGIEFAP